MTTISAVPSPPALDAVAPPPAALAEPPRLCGPAKALSALSRRAFHHANRLLVVPLHEAGLAAWLGSPVTGWQCLVTTVGRRSGLPRPTPLGYIVSEGAAWVLAGYGPSTLWYRNVLADPHVDLRLPGGRPVRCVAEAITDPVVRARIIPSLSRSMMLPGALIGCLPATSSDDRILECVSWVPLVRIQPDSGDPLVPGPDDPGGRAWIWRQGIALGVTLAAAALVRRLLRSR
jgi:deazaflavin-dependent oxidoreductase (nitroreductase family)